jgi:hypothetical protein
MSDVKMGGSHQAYFNQLEMLAARAEKAEAECDRLPDYEIDPEAL